MAHTVKFWDKASVVVTDQQAEKIKAALLSGAEMLDINGNLYKTSAIASVEKGGQLPIDHSKRLKAPQVPEITDEMRVKNLKRLAEIKEAFLERRRKRRLEEQKS
jgi:hypothetical protein